MAKERAEEAEARAARQAAALQREAAMLERRREMSAATVLQAWARGVETRNAVSAALEARGLPLLAAEQRRRVRANMTAVVGGFCFVRGEGRVVDRKVSGGSRYGVMSREKALDYDVLLFTRSIHEEHTVCA